MEDDLTWLALNVHEWTKFGDTLIARVGEKIHWLLNENDVPANAFTKEQWISRRIELQNKPSWKDAPEWACYLGQSDEGAWHWFDGEPEINEVHDSGEFWNAPGYTAITDRRGEVLGDWRDTLERRPVDLSEPAVTARLTEATENVLAAVPALMNEKFGFERSDWFERGELPPVGIECEVLVGEDWRRTRVVAALDSDVGKLPVFTTPWCPQRYVDCGPEQFRPIRTERDKAIDEMKLHCQHHGSWDTVGRIYAEALYDAGYRKQNLPAK